MWAVVTTLLCDLNVALFQAVIMESERVLVSLKSGDIYLITLLSDGMRSVKKFNWHKAATSVLTSCICMAAGRRAAF